MRLLIKSGINVHHKNNKGQSCLHWQRYAIDCAELLINAGIDIHSTDNEGQTLLYDLLDHDVFDYWVNKGCDINHRDYGGKAVLIFRLTTSGGYMISVLMPSNAMLIE